MRIIELDEIDSTSEYLKRLGGEEDVIAVARRQTGGRGTKGRSFSSETGGLYISVMRTYDNFPASDAFKILVNACVAVCKTLEKFSLKPQIKWSNDVLSDGKKISGTLIENILSGSFVSRSITGIGINVNNPLPPELNDTATSMSRQLSVSVELSEVKNTLIANLEKQYRLDDYKSRMEFGKSVFVTCGGKRFEAVVKDVEPDGRLLVEHGGKLIALSSAEVSIKL